MRLWSLKLDCILKETSERPEDCGKATLSASSAATGSPGAVQQACEYSEISFVFSQIKLA